MFAQARIPLHWEQLMKTFTLKKRFATEPSSPAVCQGDRHAQPSRAAGCRCQGTTNVSTGLEIQAGIFKRVPVGHEGLDQPSSVLLTPPKYPQLHKLLFVCSERAKSPPSQSIPSLAGIP